MMRKATIIFLLLLVTTLAWAQMATPVKFTSMLKINGTAGAEVVFSGKIDAGWHVYSTNLGSGGPISATFNVTKLDGVELVGKLTPRGKEISNYDKIFEMKLRYFENSVRFVQKVRFTKPTYVINGYLEYGACNDEVCLPPTDVEIIESGKSPAVATSKGVLPTQVTPINPIKNSISSATGTDTTTVKTLPKTEAKSIWAPVTAQMKANQGGNSEANDTWLYIFAMGFVGGLLALFTPCVWPIIPMTVSFFLKRSKDRRKGIADAIIYGVSIIGIYLALGLIITAIFGPSALNALATNAIFNILFFLLLVVFALSFFGWFELRLPSKWANTVDNKATSTGGLLSIFLMAFTLTLVSFSCTGPIIGFLLVDFATSASFWGPAIGMFGFALALALPFTLFALFPSWLKQAPKSGSWMNTIKVVLGFIELAFSLKFFSVADLTYGWHLLDREVFLSLWIVIFGALGMYLIGKLKFQSDEINGKNKPMPVPCVMLGLVSLAFAMYMVPGLWGAPCKAISAFAPPMGTQDFKLGNHEVRAKYTDYDEGMAAAASQGKPALVDFTGFGCVNCRKMEAAVWTDPRVADKLTNDYVLISLFVDDKTPLRQTIDVISNGRKRTLRTIGDKWSYLQESKFGANVQPFYIALDNQGNPLTGYFSYDEDIPAYLSFLNAGLGKYGK